MKRAFRHLQAKITPGSAKGDYHRGEGQEKDATRNARAFDSGRTFSAVYGGYGEGQEKAPYV